MIGLRYFNDEYCFAFNGKENDDEVSGSGNQQDYGMRIYNNRLGRFLSIDPLTRNYAMLTPYQFASNSPIAGVDLDGLELQSIHSSMYQMKYYGSFSALNATNDKVVLNQIYDVQLINKNIPPNYKNGNKTGITVGVNGKDVPIQTMNATGMANPIKAEDDNSDPTRIKFTKKGNVKEKPNIGAQKFNAKMGALDLIVNAVTGTSDMLEDLADIDEHEDREAFYTATKWVDAYTENGDIKKIGGSAILTAQGRSDLVNYINDGTLPGSKNNEDKAYSSLIEKVGNEILKANDVDVQKK